MHLDWLGIELLPQLLHFSEGLAELGLELRELSLRICFLLGQQREFLAQTGSAQVPVLAFLLYSGELLLQVLALLSFEVESLLSGLVLLLDFRDPGVEVELLDE